MLLPGVHVIPAQHVVLYPETLSRGGKPTCLVWKHPSRSPESAFQQSDQTVPQSTELTLATYLPVSSIASTFGRR